MKIDLVLIDMLIAIHLQTCRDHLPPSTAAQLAPSPRVAAAFLL